MVSLLNSFIDLSLHLRPNGWRHAAAAAYGLEHCDDRAVHHQAAWAPPQQALLRDACCLCIITPSQAQGSRGPQRAAEHAPAHATICGLSTYCCPRSKAAKVEAE